MAKTSPLLRSLQETLAISMYGAVFGALSSDEQLSIKKGAIAIASLYLPLRVK